MKRTKKQLRKDMTTREANEILVSDLKQVVNDAEELLKATAGEAGEKAKEVRKRLGTALEKAKANCVRLQDKALDAARSTDDTIRDHPYESIGVCFGVGLLLGVLVGGRR
jgi:ElaB/YqjD/DUF883 family membrane-anchored ribosome-binding protein